MVVQDVGILAMDAQFPGKYVEMSELEQYDNCPGKYTKGIGQKQMGFVSDNEDAVSLSMTALENVMKTAKLTFHDIGRLEIGTESQVDRSKSIKSYLMDLFAASGNHDVEGTDTYHACYGGTNAVMNTISWVQSLFYKPGKVGIVICSDVALLGGAYKFAGGGATVAIVIGPNAPLRMNPIRSTYMAHRWDFYKPVGWHRIEPITDMRDATNQYNNALLGCYRNFPGPKGQEMLDTYDYFLFHSTSSYMSIIAFQTLLNEMLGTNYEKTDPEFVKIYNKKVLPAMESCKRTGSNYTAAVYNNLMSLLYYNDLEALKGKKILLYSYGSGSASSMFEYEFIGNEKPKLGDVQKRLDDRTYCTVEEYLKYNEKQLNIYKKFGVEIEPDDNMQDGVYYLEKIDDMGRRHYHRYHEMLDDDEEEEQKNDNMDGIEIEDCGEYQKLILHYEDLGFLNKQNLKNLHELFQVNTKPVVIVSKSENFGLGARLNDGDTFGEEQIKGLEYYQQFLEMMDKSIVPITVYCHGNTRGGSMGIIACADRVVAHSNSSFGYPEIRRGGLPGYVSVVSNNRLKINDAKWLMLTGDAFDVKEARSLGWVDEISDEFVYKELPCEHKLKNRKPESLDTCATILQDRFMVFKNPGQVLGPQNIPKHIRVVFIIVEQPLKNYDNVDLNYYKFWRDVHCPVILITNNQSVESALEWSTYIDLRYCLDKEPTNKLNFDHIQDEAPWTNETYWNGIVDYETDEFILRMGQYFYERRPLGMKKTLSLMRRNIPIFSEKNKEAPINSFYPHDQLIENSKEEQHWIDVKLDEHTDWEWLESIWFETEYKPIIFHALSENFGSIPNSLVGYSKILRKSIFVHGATYLPDFPLNVDLYVRDLKTLHKVLKRTDPYLVSKCCQFTPAQTYEQAAIGMGSVTERKDTTEWKNVFNLSDSCLYELDENTKIATITLNEPFSRNAISTSLMEGFIKTAVRCMKDDVNGIILKGNGQVLSSGGSLKDMNMDKFETKQSLAYYFYKSYKYCMDLLHVGVPIHTISHGQIVGGGNYISLLGSSYSIHSKCNYTIGNNRRGVCPGGNLTRIVPVECDRSRALEFYLFDLTVSVCSKYNVTKFDEDPKTYNITNLPVPGSEHTKKLEKYEDIGLLCKESIYMADCLYDGYASLNPKENTMWYSYDMKDNIIEYINVDERRPKIHVKYVYPKKQIIEGFDSDGNKVWVQLNSSLERINSFMIVDPSQIIKKNPVGEIFENVVSLKKYMNSSKQRKKKIDCIELPLCMHATNIHHDETICKVSWSNTDLVNVKLKFEPRKKSILEPHQVEVKVHAAGGNFRDVLHILDYVPYGGNFETIGGEFAGIVTDIGSDVVGYNIGDRVFGVSENGAFQTYTITSYMLIHKIPNHLTDMEAASMSILATTVHDSLVNFSKIKPGQRILIHAAAGGVGLTAIKYAQKLNCDIIATCGSEKKRNFLKNLGIEKITSSRDPEQFKRDMEKWGAQVDIVLNALSDNFIPYSADFLVKGGHFAEVGKRKIWTEEQFKKEYPNIHYHPIAIDDYWRFDQPRFVKLFQDTMTWGQEPIYRMEYDISQIKEALELLRDAGNIGKVVYDLTKVEYPKKIDTHGKQSQTNISIEQSETIQYLLKNPDQQETYIYKKLNEIVLSLGIEEMPTKDTPWREAGFDSLAMVEFVNILKNEFTGLTFNDTTLFDHPTPEKLNQYIRSKLQGQKPRKVRTKKNNKKKTYDPIAIVGVACNFPGGCEDVYSMWEFMKNKGDAMKEIPEDRFDVRDYPEIYVKKAGFLDTLWYFDNERFNISEAEAMHMDPQQFMSLECAADAMEQVKSEIDKTSCGVFVGCSTNEFGSILNKNGEQKSSYAGTGSAVSILSNRISYIMGLNGPSMTIDTACSSSLVALDAACTKLQNGDCSSAIVIGVNTILTPEPFVSMCGAKMLSPDGRCATFSDKANGFARSEGCAAIIVKKLSDAIEDGDSVISIIHATEVNQDGTSANLTSPNGKSQEMMLENALDKANLHVDDIDFIETHGTGTALGDPIEVQSISNVFEERSEPLPLGAAKSNFGHMEGAAGMVGIVKSMMSLIYREIPPVVHCDKLNPRLQEFVDKNIIIPTKQSHKLDQNKDQLYAGISSFGFGGTNAHVIMSFKHK